MQKIPGYLTILVECMLTVAAVDKDIASPEMNLIRDLVGSNWKEEYGNLDHYIRGVARRLGERSTSTGISLESQFKRYAEYLGNYLNQTQKDQVTQVINKLILADQFIDKREKDLAEYLIKQFDPLL